MTKTVRININVDTSAFQNAVKRLGVRFRVASWNLTTLRYQQSPALDLRHSHDQEILRVLGEHPDVLEELSRASL